MIFAVEYHDHGGQCWLQRHAFTLERGIPMGIDHRGIRWWLRRSAPAPVDEGWLLAHAYGRFRFYADVIASRGTIIYDPTGELLCDVFDGVRLLADGREVVRYVREDRNRPPSGRSCSPRS